MELFDLAVIGGGPAGYRAGELAAEAGLKTILFEKKALGGVCLNEGCIPTKALLNTAKIVAAARGGARLGVKAESVTLDHAAAMAHKARTVRTLVGGVELRLKKAGVTVVKAAAVVDGRSTEGIRILADGQLTLARNLLVATGSAPVVPPIAGLAEALTSGFALTSSGMLDLKEVPGRLVVVGGGVIGLELAGYYREAGAAVEVVEMLPTIGGAIDGGASARLQKALEKAGIRFHLSAKVTAVADGAVRYERDGEQMELAADRVLVAIGRKPHTEGLGLETLGIALERCAVVTDERGRASAAGVYAAGDVNGRSMLAHTAYREAELCVNTMLGLDDRVDYDAIPSVIYTQPEVATVGLTEAEAGRRGIGPVAVEVPLRLSGRYLAEHPSGSDTVTVVTEKGTGRVLGVHMTGPYASEMIWGAAMLVERGMIVVDVSKVVFPHPTVSEALREAAFELL